ncbi:MAG: hypothetical protein ABGW99_05550 [Zunongwangia sp.]|uniref:hypothetical protein n=1 Tax=Zunongwangia sp. TaxID=1965325 RepID=UPI0032428102
MKTKILLLFFLSVLLFSCSSDDNEPEPQITTYRIVNNAERQPNENVSELDGTLYEVTVLKYIDDDLAGQDDLDPISAGGGKSNKIEISEDVEKIKVSFKWLPESSPYYDILDLDRVYTASFTYINVGEDNEIIIDGNTLVRNTAAFAPEKENMTFMQAIR